MYLIDRYQNAIPRAMLLHELEKVQLKHFTVMTQDFIGCLKILCMSILLLRGGIESKWKCCSSPLSIEKTPSVRL